MAEDETPNPVSTDDAAPQPDAPTPLPEDEASTDQPGETLPVTDAAAEAAEEASADTPADAALSETPDEAAAASDAPVDAAEDAPGTAADEEPAPEESAPPPRAPRTRSRKSSTGPTLQDLSDLPVDVVIDAFGGVRPLEALTAEAGTRIRASTIQGWKTRGSIPLSRHKTLIDVAAANNIPLPTSADDPIVGPSPAEDPDAIASPTEADSPPSIEKSAPVRSDDSTVSTSEPDVDAPATGDAATTDPAPETAVDAPSEAAQPAETSDPVVTASADAPDSEEPTSVADIPASLAPRDRSVAPKSDPNSNILDDEDPGPSAPAVAAVILSIVALLLAVAVPFFHEELVGRFAETPLQAEAQAAEAAREDLEARIAALEAQLGAGPGDVVSSDDLSDITTSLDQLSSRVEGLAGLAQTANDRAQSLESDVRGYFEDTVLNLQTNPDDPIREAILQTRGLRQEMDVVQGLVDGLERRLDGVQATAGDERLNAIENRVTQLATRVTEEMDALTASTNALEARLADQVAATEARLNQSIAAGDGENAEAVTETAEEVLATLRDELADAQGTLEATIASLSDDTASTLDQLRDGQSALGDDLETRAAALEEAVAGLREGLEAAEAELGPLQEQLQAVSNRRLQVQALMISVTQLREQLATQGGFEPELANVRAQLSEDTPQTVTEALDALDPIAPAGVVTLRELEVRFLPLPTAILRASVIGQDSDWAAQTWAHATQGFRIQRIDPPGERSNDLTLSDHVAQAEIAMREDNLEGAVRALNQIPEDEEQVWLEMGPWVRDAEAYLVAQHAMDSLTQHAMTLLNQAAGGDGASE